MDTDNTKEDDASLDDEEGTPTIEEEVDADNAQGDDASLDDEVENIGTLTRRRWILTMPRRRALTKRMVTMPRRRMPMMPERGRTRWRRKPPREGR